MPLSVQHISEIRRTVVIPFDGETISVTYRLSAFNSDLADWLHEHGDDRRSIQQVLERVGVRWDILDNGTPIPITVEAMDRYHLPTPLLNLIYREINLDASPNALKASYFPGSPTASAVARNGTKSS